MRVLLQRELRGKHALRLMHANVNGQDVVGAPRWHTPSDKHPTTADFMACACQGLNCIAYALFGEAMR